MSATDQDNPYQPPKGDAANPSTRRPIERASKGRRFGTLVVDYIGFIVCAGCLGIAIALVFGDSGIEKLQRVPDVALGVPVMLGYYVFFEGLFARTPGKMIFGTVVVNESGDRPSFAQVVGRTLCRFIPFEVFSFLGDRGWHDSIPKTHVVLARRR